MTQSERMARFEANLKAAYGEAVRERVERDTAILALIVPPRKHVRGIRARTHRAVWKARYWLAEQLEELVWKLR